MHHCRISRTRKWICCLVTLCLVFFTVEACSQERGPSSETESSVSISDQTKPAEPLNDPMDVFLLYAEAWERFDFETMYALISSEDQETTDQASFISRYENIMSGIEASHVVVTAKETESLETALVVPDQNIAFVPFQVEMETLAGPISMDDYQMKLVLEQTEEKAVWKIDWSEKLIFPSMEPGDKVKARYLSPKRGELYDRNGMGLAVNGELITIGIAPGSFSAVKDEAIPQMADLLGISEERIHDVYENATNPDWFYPIVTLPSDASDLASRLTAIDGVLYQKTSGRVYPAGAAAARVVGYISPITEEELAERSDQDYTNTDQIGKMGLEQVYEERLRGQKGGEITIVNEESGQLRDVIARKEPVDGEQITVTLDVTAQMTLYEIMKEDAGASAAINPQTGEILALVSTPSFDPNYFQTYIPDAVAQSWDEATKSPFINRFSSGYAPGSVFKLVTAAIGLKAGTLDPDEALPITGKKWQPDASWGDYMITRVKDIGRPVNLTDAMIYSDNIYFAQQALRLGCERFSKGAEDFAIGTDLPIEYPFYRSQLSNQGLNSDILLADTAFGQGEVLLTPLHVALFYSTLATDGNLMRPILEMNDMAPTVWKEQAIAAKDVSLLSDILIQVVEDPNGTAYTKTPAVTRMLGKTGTAELKKSLEDTDAEENGWFVAMNVENPRLTIAMMIEEVKNKGGSHYVVPLVKQAMDELLAD